MILQDLISIIIPVYNIEGFLPRCLETVAGQSYPNLEIILVDDGSTDSSGNICDEFAKSDSRAVVLHKKNEGQGPARNSGKRIAKGQFIMFVDGDDYLHLDAVKLLYESLSLNSDCDFAMMNYKETTSLEEDVCNNVTVEQTTLSQQELMEGFFGGSSLFNPVWNKLYKKNIVKNIWSRDYKRGQDSDYALRVILNTTQAVWIKSPLYFYYQRQNSITHHPDYVITGYKCHAQFLFDNINELPADKECYLHFFLRDLYRVMINYISGAWYSNQKDEAIRQCQQYEKTVRDKYWKNTHFGWIEKTAMTVKVRYPHWVRKAKKITKGKLSWHLLKKF